MDKELEVYYDQLLDMFGTQGWKTFVQDCKETYEEKQQSAEVDCITNEAWHYRRGELAQLRRVVCFERFTRQWLEDINNVVV